MDDTSTERTPSQASIPVLEERLEVERRTVPTGIVRISRTTETRETVVDPPLVRESVDVERVPIGRVLADGERPEPRQDGDALVVPVLEEVLVVERRWVLKEELRVRRKRDTFHAPQRTTLRSERVTVERLDADGRPVPDGTGTHPPPNP